MLETQLIPLPALVAAVVLSLSPVVRAQSASESPPHDRTSAPEREEIQRPEALEPFRPEYPAEAQRDGIDGVVVLRLGIGADGVVTEAEVMEPAGHGFDEAARAAALRVRFRPARRGDHPLASRVLTRVEFHLPPAPIPAPPVATAPSAVSPAPAPRVSEAPEVTVHGLSDAEKRRQSAEAVTVIETEQAQRESSDTGRVLARTQGVGVRRAGGLGSTTRFSLNGLTDDQVRFFLDGVPLELSGYPFGVANVPINLVERIELYSGVVPVRLGADALGGAVNLVSERDLSGTHGSGSYQVGSFGTYRVTASARHLDDASGFFSRLSGFLDTAQNDFVVDVEVPDRRGHLSPARVHRFHDAYRAEGAVAELGFVHRRWAKRLLVRAFVTDYDKEYQHNQVMTVPYGEVTYGELSAGATARYEQYLGRGISLDALAGYTYTRGHFLDVADCVYDWFGHCGRARVQPGETDSKPHDSLSWDRSGFGRVNLEWRANPVHALRLALSPTYLDRTGDERRQSDPTARDPLSAERRLLTVVNGVEYQADVLEDRLQGLLFAKQYVQRVASEEPRPGNTFRRRDRNTQRFGWGSGMRYRFAPWLYAKASYELATRLPRPDEVFGDNAFIVANLELEPETSHNGNLGATLDLKEARSGSFRATVNGFYRNADQLILLVGSERVQSYQNVYGARSLGVEGAAGWSSQHDYVSLDANLTYQDFRNTSQQGTFGDFAGDRIPNRPYLFGNARTRLQAPPLLVPGDELSLTWSVSYVHEYFRSWESLGLREFKQVIPSQVVHDLGLGFVVPAGGATFSTTLEVQNLTDEPVYDFFGVQRPGRAFSLKATVRI